MGDYGCLMADLPKVMADKVRGFGLGIDDRYLNNVDGHGREDYPHVTVKYGLIYCGVEDLLPIVFDFKPFDVTIHSMSIFKGDSVVLKLSVDSVELRELHSRISRELKNNDGYLDYSPHITIAYLKKSKRLPYYFQNMYTDEFDGLKFTVDTLTYSDKGEEHKISL